MSELSSTERMMLLRFLCDEACSSDKVQRVINVKLKQVIGSFAPDYLAPPLDICRIV